MHMVRRHILWMRNATSWIVAGSVALSGCTVGPRFRPEHMEVGAAFVENQHIATSDEIRRTNLELIDWWNRFNDPLLTKLVTRAVEGNYDLRIAGQRILAERAMRDVQASAWYPQVDANAGGGDDRHSINIDNWPIRPGNPLNRPEASYLTYGVSASWEIDVFGRIRRAVQAQEELVRATIEDRRAILMTMLSSLVIDYLTLRDVQLRLDIANRNIATATDAYNLSTRLYLEGVGNTLQTAQAKAELDAQTAAREPLKTSISQLCHAIAVLIGEMPGSLELELKIPSRLPDVPAFPEALPSMVIANRPDIRRAERSYAEATARIGVAVAQLYPHFVIPINFNPNASAMYQLFEAGALSWQFLMMASMPLMHGGRLKSQVKAARAAAQASRVEYRQTVLTAFKEVEDAIVAWNNDREYVALLKKAADDSALANERARRLYAAGLTGFLDVLTTERTALNAENAQAAARLNHLIDAVNLYVALGAGWQGVSLTAQSLPVSLSQQNALARAFKQ